MRTVSVESKVRWRSAERKFVEVSEHTGRKFLFHSLRYRIFAIHLIREGKLIDYSIANEVFIQSSDISFGSESKCIREDGINLWRILLLTYNNWGREWSTKLMSEMSFTNNDIISVSMELLKPNAISFLLSLKGVHLLFLTRYLPLLEVLLSKLFVNFPRKASILFFPLILSLQYLILSFHLSFSFELV